MTLDRKVHPKIDRFPKSKEFSVNLRVRIRGLEMLVFRKILRVYLMDDPIYRIS